MFIVVGLGNPGKEYECTRHNIGFRIVDFFVDQNNFSKFRHSKKYNAFVSEGLIRDSEALIIKPQSFMNLSGTSIRTIIDFYKLNPTSDLIVVSDDADVKIGQIKIQKGKSSAGHKGVQSIIKEVGTKEFTRIRIGIDSEDPAYRIPALQNGLEDVVLKNFTESEEKVLKNVISEACEHIKNIISSDKF
ncbi:MAG: aminoacyl-tRNA hydrolase [Candidatus Paceibacterota bacterium]|jgi:PTH1 family peptidyl-tRNA hydrolase|nr:aminoacyl-tRNA hydrolase [bacterium]